MTSALFHSKDKVSTILALDTSTPICSVALKRGENVYSEEYDTERDHAEHLLPLIMRVLKKGGLSIQDVDLTVCSRGPGSFFGLRTALSAAKGFYAALRTPFVTILTHEIYRKAHQNQNGTLDHPVIAVVRATKTCLFVATYRETHYKMSHAGRTNPQQSEIEQIPLKYIGGYIAACNESRGKAPLVTSIDLPLLEEIQDSIARDSQHADLPCNFTHTASSAPALLQAGYERYIENGGDALDINPYYLRMIDAEKFSR